MYMNHTVGVAELRQNLSRYLRRVARGERLLVTDRNRPVAELGPPPTSGAELDRLIAEGRVSRPVRVLQASVISTGFAATLLMVGNAAVLILIGRMAIKSLWRACGMPW